MGRCEVRAWGSIGAILALLGGALMAGTAWAQQRILLPTGLPQPQVLIVQPTGGKAGETVEVTVSGTDLEEPQGLLFSQPGIEAESIGTAPAPVFPANNVRGRIMGGTTAPLMSHKFRVTLPADAPPGIHDLRLVNRWGVSNPRAFVVGDLGEVAEAEPNDDVAQAQRVALGTTVNGTIASPTDVDDLVFAGQKGRRVIVAGLASSIDSRLVMTLELYDATGRRLAANHEYHGTDALLDATLPADGDYLVRVSAFSYAQGGPEHFYRVSLSTAPWIDAVFPPMVEPGKPARVTVFGRNLPGGQPDPSAVVEGRPLERLDATIEAPGDPRAFQALAYRGHLLPNASALDGIEFRLRNEAGTSNPVLVTLAGAPVVLDRGGNDTPESAQEVAVPCEIAGRIEAKRDRDWYAFDARKGDVLRIEAFGDRLGAPLDLYLVLRDAATRKVLAEADDPPELLRPGQGRAGQGGQDRGALQFYTRTDDPDRIRVVVPRDGRYQLLVSSREAPTQAGPRHVYRVRVGPEQPDFRLVVMPPSGLNPDACVVRRGGRTEASIFVWRLDGFDGPIALAAEGLPPGVTCPPQVVGTGQKQATLVLDASDDAAPWEGAITVTGSATIQDRTVVREARAATISWPTPAVPQAIAIPAISRVDRGLVLAVRDQAPFRLTAGITEATVRPGETLTVPLTLDRHWPDVKAPVQVTATGLPGPLTLPTLTLPAGQMEARATLNITPNVSPGVYSIIFRGQTTATVKRDPKGQLKVVVSVTQPSTPVTLTIVPREPARDRSR